jgi:hypothetical protein
MQTCFTRILFVPALLFALTGTAQAQIRYGIKAGLNFATFQGPSETDNSGAELESWRNYTGFHLGISFSHDFTDLFGIRGELIYNKLGSKYRHAGPQYFNVRSASTSTFTTGTGDLQLIVSNTYVTVPVTAYARWGDFEFSAGPYVSALVQSVGDGSLSYTGTSPGTGELRFNLLHNYRRDDPGEFTEGSDKVIARIGGNDIELPKTIGAYYDYPEDRGALYNAFDYGVVGGVSYFLSRTLFFAARLQYGLADVTNNDADRALSQYEPGGTPVYRADTDRNFAVQVSIGFSF